MSEKSEELELKLVFVERALQELSDVVYRQQRELDELRRRLATAQDQLERLRSDEAGRQVEDERPPHY